MEEVNEYRYDFKSNSISDQPPKLLISSTKKMDTSTHTSKFHDNNPSTSQALRNVHNLSKDISVNNLTFVYDKNGRDFHKSSLMQRRSRQLYIKLKRKPGITTSVEVQKLFKALLIFSQQNGVFLDFGYCSFLSGQNSQVLSHYLNMNCQTEHLMLNLKYIKLDLNQIYSISKPIYSYSNLKSLEINFAGNQGIDDEGIVLIAKTLKNLVFLRKLSVDISGNTQNFIKGIIALKLSIENSLLEEFTLKIAGCYNIQSDGLAILLASFETLQSLKTLILDMKSCRFSENITLLLAQQIQILKNLRNIRLNFDSTFMITSNSMQFLTEVLLSKPNLTILDLNFRDYKEECEIWLLYISISLNSGFNYLKSLCLDFRWCRTIDNLALESLGQSLRNLKGLKKLKLDFSWSKSITDFGIETLSKGIDELIALNSLILIFDGCSGIEGKSIGDLAIVIVGIEELIELSLGFNGCYLPKLETTTIELLNDIKDFKGLKYYLADIQLPKIAQDMTLDQVLIGMNNLN